MLQQAARDVGLDPEALHEALRSQRYRPRVEALLQQAADEEVEIIPAFRLGQEFQIDGFLPYEDLVDLVSQRLA